MTKEQLSKYYLDFGAVNSLASIEERELIHSYYRDMVSISEEGRDSAATSFFNTLEKGGFIKNRETEDRQEKIDIINE